MNIKKSIVITLISISSLIGMTKTGTSAAQFLKIGPMAGIMGTGESGVANVRDLAAIHYNPAGLSRYRTQAVTFTQSNWLVNTNYYYFAGSMDFSNAGVVGFHITTLDYGDMLVRTVEEPDGTGEYFGSQDLSIGLAYSKNLTDRFSIGGQVKYISQEIWHMSAATAAIDLGALFITQFNGIRLGMSITNFGGKMMLAGRDVQFYHDPATDLYGNNDQIPAEYKLNKWPLPLTFRVGLSGEAFDSRKFRLSWNVDAIHPSDNTEYLNVGSELEFNRMFYLRTGIRTLFVKNREGGAAFGGGIKYAFSPSFKIKFDYAYIDYGNLQQINMFTMSLNY